MFVSQNFKLGFRDVDKNLKITNKAILGCLEDVAGVHSTKVGYGLLDIPSTHLTWFLISWKVKVFKRPMYGDNVIATTWSKTKNKIYAFRNFELKNENNEILAIASSKWVPIDTKENTMIKLSDEIFDKYQSEPKTVFEDEENYKIKAPNEFEKCIEFKVNKSMIDMQNHVHNTYYLDFLLEILPDELQEKEINEFEILYKNQISYNDVVKLYYTNIEDKHYVVIKSIDDKILHTVIEMKI